MLSISHPLSTTESCTTQIKDYIGNWPKNHTFLTFIGGQAAAFATVFFAQKIASNRVELDPKPIFGAFGSMFTMFATAKSLLSNNEIVKGTVLITSQVAICYLGGLFD